MKMRHNTVIAIFLLATGSFTPAFSQDDSNNNEVAGKRMLSAGIGFPDNSQPSQRKVGLGIGPFPEYEGSDEYAASTLPLIDIRKPAAYFLQGASINANDGLASAGLTIFHLSYSEESGRHVQLVMGLLIRAYRGRDETDSDVLNGLGDIEQGVGVGGFLEFNAGAWFANFTVSPEDVGRDHDGLLLAFVVEHSAQVSDGLRISTGLSTSWADDDYMQGYFGVTDAQATWTGLSRFDSNAGFKDVGIQLNVVNELSPRWSLEGEVGYWRLLNDAADSPIVKGEGSTNQVRGLIGLSYQF